MGVILKQKDVVTGRIPSVESIREVASQAKEELASRGLTAIPCGALAIAGSHITARSDVDIVICTDEAQMPKASNVLTQFRRLQSQTGVTIDATPRDIVQRQVPLLMIGHVLHCARAVANQPGLATNIEYLEEMLATVTPVVIRDAVAGYMGYKDKYFNPLFTKEPKMRKLQRALELPVAIGRNLVTLARAEEGLLPYVTKSAALQAALDADPLEEEVFKLHELDLGYTQLVQALAVKQATAADHAAWLDSHSATALTLATQTATKAAQLVPIYS